MDRLLIAFILLVSCQVNAQQGQVFYYLKVSTRNVAVQVTLNGFPVYDINNEGEVSNQIPVNLALIGKGNRLVVKAEGKGDNSSVSGSISLYKGGDVVSTSDERAGQLEFEFVADGEVEKVLSFDNETFDFSSSLTKTPILDDLRGLQSYGENFLKLMISADTESVLREMDPKIDDTAKAFSVQSSMVRNSLKQMLESSLFRLPIIQLKRTQINAIPYCDGRIWELTDSNGKPLIHVKQSDGTMSMQIYVAMIDGKLRIIR